MMIVGERRYLSATARRRKDMITAGRRKEGYDNSWG
jgi:hypothetical protein